MRLLQPYLLLIPTCGVLILLLGSTFVSMIMQSFGLLNLSGKSEFSWLHWINELNNVALHNALGYSIKVAIVSSVLSVIIALPIAITLNHMDKGNALMSVVIKAPLFVPALVAAFLIVNVIAYQGILNQALLWLGFIERPLRMQNDNYGIGVIVIQIWKNMPFALLLITGSIGAIKKDILDAAQDMGASRWSKFMDVYLPLSLKACSNAATLIFIGVLGDFAIFSIAGPRNAYSLSTMMHIAANQTGAWGQAAVIGVVMMMVSALSAIVFNYLTHVCLKRWR